MIASKKISGTKELSKCRGLQAAAGCLKVQVNSIIEIEKYLTYYKFKL